MVEGVAFGSVANLLYAMQPCAVNLADTEIWGNLWTTGYEGRVTMGDIDRRPFATDLPADPKQKLKPLYEPYQLNAEPYKALDPAINPITYLQNLGWVPPSARGDDIVCILWRRLRLITLRPSGDKKKPGIRFPSYVEHNDCTIRLWVRAFIQY